MRAVALYSLVYAEVKSESRVDIYHVYVRAISLTVMNSQN